MHEINRFLLIRYFQISIALAFAVWFAMFFNINRGYWIPMTVMIMFGPFEEGTVAIRIKERMIGTFIGILLGVVLVATLQLSQIFIYTLPLFIFIIAYFVTSNYVIASTFITLMVIFIFALINPSNISPTQFGIDRMLDTLIAGFICISFEMLFSRANLTKKTIEVSIEDLLKAYSAHLAHLIESLAMDQSITFEFVNLFNESILKFQKQIDLSRHRFYKGSFSQVKLDKMENKLHEIRVQLAVVHYLVKFYHLELKRLYIKNKAIFDNLMHCYKEESITGKPIHHMIDNNLLSYDQNKESEVMFIESILMIHQLFVDVFACSID